MLDRPDQRTFATSKVRSSWAAAPLVNRSSACKIASRNSCAPGYSARTLFELLDSKLLVPGVHGFRDAVCVEHQGVLRAEESASPGHIQPLRTAQAAVRPPPRGSRPRPSEQRLS